MHPTHRSRGNGRAAFHQDRRDRNRLFVRFFFSLFVFSSAQPPVQGRFLLENFHCPSVLLVVVHVEVVVVVVVVAVICIYIGKVA